VPPPPHELRAPLGNLEQYLRDRESLPTLIQCGLAHAQFETIHPFLDGNGRVGRLLITLLLCERGILQRPLLYLSYYLKAHRAAYYDRLSAIRTEGDWEGWLRFFLGGVIEVSENATETARLILALREKDRAAITAVSASASPGLLLLDLLFEQPIVTVNMVAERLGCTFVTAGKTIHKLEELSILREVSGQRRNRRYRYDRYLELFERQIAGGTEKWTSS
jgi:Fic family protein